MARDRAPEVFHVGETIAYGRGKGFPYKTATVLDVKGIEVIVDLAGKEEHFKSRRVDGKHIRLGEDFYAFLPYIIFHPKKVSVLEARFKDFKLLATNLIKRRS